MDVLHTIVNGSSTSIDRGAYTCALHLRMSRLNGQVAWGHVASESTIADGGSCDDAKRGMTAKYGISPRIFQGFLHRHGWHGEARDVGRPLVLFH